MTREISVSNAAVNWKKVATPITQLLQRDMKQYTFDLSHEEKTVLYLKRKDRFRTVNFGRDFFAAARNWIKTDRVSVVAQESSLAFPTRASAVNSAVIKYRRVETR